MLKIIIPKKPLTTNHIYGQAKNGRRFIKPEGLAFQQMVKLLMRGKTLKFDDRSEFLRVEYYFHLSNFFTLKGQINKHSGDCDNFKKLLQDSIFKCLGINDGVICNTEDFKLPSKKDRTIVIIKPKPISELPISDEKLDMVNS